VTACLGCSWAGNVIVVDDGSDDATAEKAAAAGARVVRVEGSGGSKADAMYAGVEASIADAILFVDADCLGLTSDHLDELCRPFADARAVMSLGFFDYGVLNPLVRRLPPITGERVLPRWVFDAVPAHKKEGWKIEIAINEVVAERRLPTVARTMRGVTHRTKREKLGRVEGYMATWRMFREVVGMVNHVRWRGYWFYLRNLTVERGT
jgi:glycosyltransferase involved in cell wall biosynthesis